MLNPLHTNRIKVVRVFDWACGNIVRSLACNVSYVQATLGTTYTLLIAVVFCKSPKIEIRNTVNHWIFVLTRMSVAPAQT